jgi:DNA-binding transcriptional ArsR family regulator
MPQAEAGSTSFDAELDRLRQLEPELLLSAFVRPLADHGGRPTADEETRRIATERAAAGGDEVREAVGMLLDDPAAFAQAFAALLADYWQAGFGEMWARIEEPLEQSIGEAGRRVAQRDVWSALGRLPRNCRVDSGRRELVIDLPHDHRVEVGPQRPLVLTPSFFVWPHLRFNCDLPWPLAIIYTPPELARDAEPRVPEAELLRMLRAVADDTRLRVLRLVAERPRTTQELEPLVGLSRAGLSKALQRLAEAGLVVPKRDGYYVVYHLASDQVEALGDAITRFLDR